MNIDLGRREMLTAAGGSFAMLSLPLAAAGAPPLRIDGSRREDGFDDGWRFTRGEMNGAHLPAFDDAAWRVVDLPHDWGIENLPDAQGDGMATADPVLWSTPPHPPRRIGPFDADAPLNATKSGGQALLPLPAGLSTSRYVAFTLGGVGWYRKRFRADALATDAQVELHFDGISVVADVWVNGTHMGRHPYGYTGISLDLTGIVDRTGDNVVAVRVAHEGSVSRWYAGSGIYRHASMTVTGPVRVPRHGLVVKTQAADARTAALEVAATVDNRRRVAVAATVEVSIADATGREVARDRKAVTIPAGGSVTPVSRAVVPTPALWSPERPSLYRCRVRVVDAANAALDEVDTVFGIRTVRLDSDRGLLVNGAPVKLRGASVHSAQGLLGARAIDRGEERQVELLKTSGFNAVRCAHNPPSPAFLDACDRLGLFVYAEIFDTWYKPHFTADYAQEFAQDWPDALAGMVRRDRNHPSVIIWSIGNEIPGGDTPNGALNARTLRAAVRAMDDTRPVTGTFLDPAELDLNDLHYAGLFDKGLTPAQVFDRRRAQHPDRAIVSSESWPYAAADTWREVERRPYMIGDFVWAGIDYLGEVGTANLRLAKAGTPTFEAPSDCCVRNREPTYPWISAYCGDIDLIGEKKPQSFYRDVVWGRSPLEMFSERPTPDGMVQSANSWGWVDELPGWTWPVAAGNPVRVNVYTRGDRVDLLLNGRPVASRTLAEADGLRAQFEVPYAPGIIEARAFRDGREIGRRQLHTAGTPAALRLVADRTALTADPGDLAFVRIEVVDRAGRRVPDAVVRVTAEVGGAGRLVAMGNANPKNVDSFAGPSRATFHGAAMAIVQPAGAGRILVRCTAPGLRPAIATLAATRPSSTRKE